MYIPSIRLLLLTFAVLFSACKKDNPDPIVSKELLQAVNALRKTGCRCGQDDMPPANALQWNTQLETAADLYARNMQQKGFFSHIGLDGTAPVNRAQNAGYTGDYVGENIGKGYVSIDQVMKAWQQSESHCKAMMDTLYTEMGAAEYKSYWVIEFGARGR